MRRAAAFGLLDTAPEELLERVGSDMSSVFTGLHLDEPSRTAIAARARAILASRADAEALTNATQEYDFAKALHTSQNEGRLTAGQVGMCVGRCDPETIGIFAGRNDGGVGASGGIVLAGSTQTETPDTPPVLAPGQVIPAGDERGALSPILGDEAPGSDIETDGSGRAPQNPAQIPTIDPNQPALAENFGGMAVIAQLDRLSKAATGVPVGVNGAGEIVLLGPDGSETVLSQADVTDLAGQLSEGELEFDEQGKAFIRSTDGRVREATGEEVAQRRSDGDANIVRAPDSDTPLPLQGIGGNEVANALVTAAQELDIDIRIDSADQLIIRDSDGIERPANIADVADAIGVPRPSPGDEPGLALGGQVLFQGDGTAIIVDDEDTGTVERERGGAVLRTAQFDGVEPSIVLAQTPTSFRPTIWEDLRGIDREGAGVELNSESGGVKVTPGRSVVPPFELPNNDVDAKGFNRSDVDAHQYLVETEVIGRFTALELSAFSDALVADPTLHATDMPASPNGTRNNANPPEWYGRINPLNKVLSYVIPSPDPSRYSDLVVNYTIAGEHILNEGYVVRFAELDGTGAVTLRTYGEGAGYLQSPTFLANTILFDTHLTKNWRRTHDDIIGEANALIRQAP